MRENFVYLVQHIEKTGGSSLQRDFLVPAFGYNHIYNFDPKSNSFRIPEKPPHVKYPALARFRQLLSKSFLEPILRIVSKEFTRPNEQRLSWEQVNVAEKPLLIRGHYAMNHVRSIRHNFATVVLRDPRARMISQYMHYFRLKGKTRWRVEMPYDEICPITFEEYALDERMLNYQAQAICAKNLDAYDFVGITPDLATLTSAIIYSLDLQTTPQTVGVVNNAPANQRQPVLTPEFMSKFQAAHATDYALYEEAVGRNQKQKAELSRNIIAV